MTNVAAFSHTIMAILSPVMAPLPGFNGIRALQPGNGHEMACITTHYCL